MYTRTGHDHVARAARGASQRNVPPTTTTSSTAPAASPNGSERSREECGRIGDVAEQEREHAGAEHRRAVVRDQQHVAEQAQHEPEQDQLAVGRLERTGGEPGPDEGQRGDRLGEPQAGGRTAALGPQQARDGHRAQQVRTPIRHGSPTRPAAVHAARHCVAVLRRAVAPQCYTAGTRSALEGDATCDVCVVGAGIAGCATALELAERGYRVILLEAERVGWGASGRSGGQAIFGYGTAMSSLAAQVGPETARRLWDVSVEALDFVRERVARHAIDCDLHWGHLHVATKPRQRERTARHCSASWPGCTTTTRRASSSATASRRCSRPRAIAPACSIRAAATCTRSTTRWASRRRRSPLARASARARR